MAQTYRQEAPKASPNYSSNIRPFAPKTDSERAFHRRKHHAGITDMTVLILRWIGYAEKRRHFVAAMQGLHGCGKDAEKPGATFHRSALTLASRLNLEGADESKRSGVSRYLDRHEAEQRRTGYLVIEVIRGNKHQKTGFVDHITPLADEAHIRRISSDLWKTGKREDKEQATQEAVEWAVSRLPKVDPEDPDEGGGPILPLSDYIDQQLKRQCASAEKVADRIETFYDFPGESDRYLDKLISELQAMRYSRRKTRSARLSAVGEPPPPCAGIREAAGGSGSYTTVSSSVPPAEDCQLTPESIDGHLSPTESTPEFLDSSDPPLEEDHTWEGSAEANWGEPEGEENPLSELGQRAVEYSQGGMAVVPNWHAVGGACACRGGDACGSPGKHPRHDKVTLPSGILSASADPVLVEQWWRQFPEANVGWALGEDYIALDFDGPEGLELYEGWKADGTLPETLESVTGSGGRHAIVRADGLTLKNTVKVIPGLDIRANGAQIIVEPSHNARGAYRWLNDLPVAPMTERLRGILEGAARDVGQRRPKGEGKKSVKVSGSGFAGVPLKVVYGEGERNNSLFQYGCWLRGKRGFDEQQIAAELRNRNNDPSRYPVSLPEGEVRKIAASAAGYPKGGARC